MEEPLDFEPEDKEPIRFGILPFMWVAQAIFVGFHIASMYLDFELFYEDFFADVAIVLGCFSLISPVIDFISWIGSKTCKPS